MFCNLLKDRKSEVVAFYLVCAMGVHGVALAQPYTIEEVMVTAQKRSESVNDVPISITALSGSKMENSGIKSTDDLQAVVPGVEFRKQLNAFTPFIRGIGSQNGAVGTDMSVALYIDGVYQSLGAANAINFNNIERIEVLKGPQGTLFGRNATGGAVSVVTRNPEAESSGRVSVGYSNYDTYTFDFYGTTGLTQNLAANLAVSYFDREEGYDTSATTGEDLRLHDALSIRNKWLWTPTDLTAVNLSLGYEEEYGAESGFTRILYPSAIGTGGHVPAGGFRETTEDYLIARNSGGDFDGEYAARESESLTLRIDHSFDLFDVMSVSGYLDQKGLHTVDQDSGPDPFLEISLNYFNEQVSQEIQFISNSDGKLSWFAGIYYLNAKHFYDPFRISGLAATPADYVDIRPTVETDSMAAYADFSYLMTASTKLTAGFRESREEKSMSGNTIATINGANIPVADFNESETWTEPTWRLVLDHSLTEDLLAYASYSRGYKSGSYNTLIQGPGDVKPPVDPEKVDSFEIGLKGDLLDGRIAFSSAAFYSEFDDIQVSQQVVGGTTLVNAASAEIQGFELNGQYLMNYNFSVGGGVAYTDATYEEFPMGPSTQPTGVGGNSSVSADLSGNRIPRTPEWSGNLVMDYRFDTSVGHIDSNLTVDLHLKLTQDLHLKLTHPLMPIMA
jgi:iron complex outermembrane receptor protein